MAGAGQQRGKAKRNQAGDQPVRQVQIEVVLEEKQQQPSEHQQLIAGWGEAFQAHFGFAYAFAGGRDAKAVKALLATGIPQADLLRIAKSAWVRSGKPPKSFNCEQAATLAGFQNYLNQIRAELKNGNQPFSRHYSGPSTFPNGPMPDRRGGQL